MTQRCLALRAIAKAMLSFLVLAAVSATPETTGLLLFHQDMVHPGGFEPPTARFVAEYSIQLSYGCIGKLFTTQIQRALLRHTEQDGASGRMTQRCLALRAIAKAMLSFLVLAAVSATPETTGLLLFHQDMVHPGGFEPPTARFVAEYSIQLSYGCIGKLFTTQIQRRITSPH